MHPRPPTYGSMKFAELGPLPTFPPEATGDVSLYVLIDPDDRSVRYVGISQKPFVRLESHLSATVEERRNWRLHAWIEGLIATGTAPELRILRRLSPEDAKRAEISLIRYMQGTWDLYNITPGGEGKFKKLLRRNRYQPPEKKRRHGKKVR